MNTQGRPRPTQKGFQRENDKSQSAAASQLANMRGKGKSINELSPECNRISNGPNIYQIGAEIGRGGFAVVYSAFNVKTGDFVAVKRFPLSTIDDESLSKIQDEIELMQQLNHENIVKYIDTIKTKAYLHIVLEYVENGSLQNVIKKFGSFSESLTAIYITQVLRGLKYLHVQGVLHRDIKGANILTTKEGMVKLADFGVATKLTDEGMVGEQGVVGSPYWIAPEIIEMSTPTTACDIWSVGCIVIELLTGKPPYYDLAPMAALFRIVQDDYPPLPEGISQALQSFLMLCFQKEPMMRGSAETLLEHPWLQNSSTSKSLERTTSNILTKTKYAYDITGGTSSASSDKSSINDSIVNTIKRFRSEIDTSSLQDVHKVEVGSGSGGSHNDAVKGRSRNNSSVENTVSITHDTKAGNDRIDRRGGSSGTGTFVSEYISDEAAGRRRSESSDGLSLSKGASAFGPARESINTGTGKKLEAAVGVAGMGIGYTPHLGSSSSQTIPNGQPFIDIASASDEDSMSSGGSLHLFIGDNNVTNDNDTNSDSEAETPRAGSRRNYVKAVPSAPSLSTSPFSDRSADTPPLDKPTAFPAPVPTADVSRSMSAMRLVRPSSSSSGNVGIDSCSVGKKSMEQFMERDDDEWDVDDFFQRDDSSESNNRKDNKEGFVSLDLPQSIPRHKGGETTNKKDLSRGGNEGRSSSFFLRVTHSGGKAAPEVSAVTSPQLSLKSMSFDSYGQAPPTVGILKNRGPHESLKEDLNSKLNLLSASDARSSSYLLAKYQERDDDDFGDLEVQMVQSSLSKSSQNSGSMASGSAGKRGSFPLRGVVGNSRGTQSKGKPPFGLKKTSTFHRSLKVEDDEGEIQDDDFKSDANISIDFNEKIKSYAFPQEGSYGLGPTATRSRDDVSQMSRSESTSASKGDHSRKLKLSADNNDLQIDDDDAFEKGIGSSSISSFDDFAGHLRSRMKQSTHAHADGDQDDFSYLFDEKDFAQNESKDVHFRRSREVVDIMAKIRPETKESVVVELCEQLMGLFVEYPEQRVHLITYYGVMPIIDMFEARSSAVVTNAQGGARVRVLRPHVLRVINKIIEGSTRAIEQISLVGLIPTIMHLFERSCRASNPNHNPNTNHNPAYGSGHGGIGQVNAGVLSPSSHSYSHIHNIGVYSQDSTIYGLGRSSSFVLAPTSNPPEIDPVTLETARFIHRISNTSSLTLQMLIGAGGLTVLTSMLYFGAHILPNKMRRQLVLSVSQNTFSPMSSASASPTRRSSMNARMFQEKDERAAGLAPKADLGDAFADDSNPNAKKVGEVPKSPAVPNTGSMDSASSDSTDDLGIDNALRAGLRPLDLSPEEQEQQEREEEEITKGGLKLDHAFSSSGADGEDDLSISQAAAENIKQSGNVTFIESGLQPGQSDPEQKREHCMLIFQMAVDCISQVFSVQSSRTRDFCRLFVKLGLLPHLAISFQNILALYCIEMNTDKSNKGGGNGVAADNSASATTSQPQAPSSSHHESDDSSERLYTKQTVSILFQFSRSDQVVVQTMVHPQNGAIGALLYALSSPELTSQGIGGSMASSSSASILVGETVLDSKSGADNGISSKNNNNSNNNNIGILNSSPTQERARPSIGRRAVSGTRGLRPAYVEIVEMVLKCLKNLSMEPSVLDDLEQAGTIGTIIPLLYGPISDKCRNHVLPTLYNMCRISKRRQELVAVSGVIPHLKRTISEGSHLKQFVLPILFDLARTSAITREELFKNDCFPFFLGMLKENYWQTHALDSLSIWMVYDAAKLSGLIIKPALLSKLVEFFRTASSQTIHLVHKPMLDMLFVCRDLSKALGSSGPFVLALVRRLTSTKEAIVLRSLLRMLQILHQNHPNPKEFVQEHKLVTVVEEFAQQSERKVLVRQIANKLLRDFGAIQRGVMPLPSISGELFSREDLEAVEEV